MIKKKILGLLLLSTILGPFSAVAFAVDEVTNTTTTESKESSMSSQTIDSTQNTKAEESNSTTNQSESGKNASESLVDKRESSQTTETTSQSDNESNLSDDSDQIIEDDENRYPSNRSDLESTSEESQPKVYSRAASSYISITNSNTPRSNFIDVSSHNGTISVNEFKTMKKYGVTGVVVKLTEGTTYTNPYAKSQITNAKSAGLIVSAYHFSWFTNTQKAKEEANYFSAVAKQMGLPKTTLMVNDIETEQLRWLGTNTSNSLAFANQLKSNGYSNVNHYSGLYWINEGRISPSSLGYKNIWVAAYPLSLSNSQKYTQYGAWQWSDKMTFPGVSGTYDISSDYGNKFSVPAEGKYISDGRYVTITSKSYPIWQNFDFNSSILSTKDVYQKTYLAKGRYEHSNGSTYYSLYTTGGTWIGYLNASATKIAESKNGSYISDGRYVTVNKRGYDSWGSFNWDGWKSSAEIFLKTYQAKGRYENANGSTYLSLYDDKNKWYGYINANAVGFASGPQGIYMKQNSYASISDGTTNLYNDFNGTVRRSTKDIYQNNYYLSASYQHIDGTLYYSLYDNDDKWVGYAKSNTVKVTNEACGPYITYGQKVMITSKGYPIWRNFSWVKLNSPDVYYGKTVTAKGIYKHTNGEVYYSLYSDNDTWLGYVNSKATKIVK